MSKHQIELKPNNKRIVALKKADYAHQTSIDFIVNKIIEEYGIIKGLTPPAKQHQG